MRCTACPASSWRCSSTGSSPPMVGHPCTRGAGARSGSARGPSGWRGRAAPVAPLRSGVAAPTPDGLVQRAGLSVVADRGESHRVHPAVRGRHRHARQGGRGGARPRRARAAESQLESRHHPGVVLGRGPQGQGRSHVAVRLGGRGGSRPTTTGTSAHAHRSGERSHGSPRCSTPATSSSSRSRTSGGTRSSRSSTSVTSRCTTSPSPRPQLRRRRHVRAQHVVRPGRGRQRRRIGAAPGHVLLHGDGQPRAHQAPARGGGRVEAKRLWTGNIPESDWSRLSHAVGRLAEAPLFIDDNPHCTVMEMRAKAGASALGTATSGSSSSTTSSS